MLPLEERPAWLAALPPQYDLLREPLRRLLEVQAGIQTRPFLDAFTSGLEGLTPPATVIVGDLVGPYRLLQQLGDGGMGSVWLAERADGTLKRRVALKLPRMVWARDLAARMARERDILGSLEHPNIARLYDAGVDQLGRPFLALEYIEGKRIDEYCDETALSVTARIRLFLQVLDAVDYAHVNLILHRDLKPGNVLVNQRGEVRLLDFGIAKLMSDDDSSLPVDQNSRTLARAMTPRYASPEQVQHLRLTLASDVYSLSVMLYELLVGASPLITQKGSRAEIETAILEGYLKTPSRAKIDEPTAARRASTPLRLSRVLRGDLDAVLLKALSKNVGDRYPSVAALRADLIRWLDERPVLAKPPSRISIIRKFIARNTVAVSVGSVATCTVLTATIIAILQAHEAQIESRRATATRDFLIGLFENANPELHGGRDISAREMLRRAELTLDDSPDIGVETKSELYTAVARMWAFIGDFDQAKTVTEKRIAALSVLGPNTLQISALGDLAETAIQTESMADLDKALGGLTALSEELRLSPDQRADYLWYQGWRELLAKSYFESSERFSSSLDISKQINDADRILRSTYGKALANALRGNRKGALEGYQEGKALINVMSLSAENRLRRELELLSTLYHLGEYSLGWPLMSELFLKSNRTYGDFNPSQRSVHYLWALWGIRMGRAAEVKNWLLARNDY
jgi:serine/threonine-protein kinase